MPFLAVWAVLGTLCAQTDNSLVSVNRTYLGKIKKASAGTPKETELSFDLHKMKVVTLHDYSFTISLWREKDPQNPACVNGVVSDWNRMEPLTFAAAPGKGTVVTYNLASPEDSIGGYRLKKDLRHKDSWPSYDKWDVYHSYMIQNDLLAYYAAQGITTIYVRYDLNYKATEYKMGQPRELKGYVTNSTGKLIALENTAPATPAPQYGPLKVKTQLTQAHDNGYNLNFEFPSHPKDCPYQVTLSFWREKDPLNPLYSDGRIEDFKMMDMMQFSQSTKDPSVIGLKWTNEDDYTMESEYVVGKNAWQPFSIYLPEALFKNFDPPYMPDDVNEMTARYYIMYQLSSDADFVSNEGNELPWVARTYTRAPQECTHDFAIKNNPSMYVKEIPQPETPQNQAGDRRLHFNHVHYYYLKYTPECLITPKVTIVEYKNLPDEYTFKVGQHTTQFVRNIDDRHISKTVATEGLWTVMYPDPEVSRGHSAADKTPLRRMSVEQANDLMARMNEYAQAHGMPWLFYVATCKEAKKAGYKYVETEDDDDEAFTADGCFYITAQSTLPATIATKTTYMIETKYTAECQYPNCNYGYNGMVHHANRNSMEKAEKYCQNNNHWCEVRNKRNEENLKKLMEWLQGGKVENKVEAQPKYIWYVLNHPIKECTKCGEQQQLDYSVEEFFSKEKANQYYNQLKK